MKTELVYEQETYRIRGACFEVYKEKGCGFLEAVFQECLELELGLQGIPFEAQPELALSYKGGTTTLKLDVDGDGKADYTLKINGDVTLHTATWLL